MRSWFHRQGELILNKQNYALLAVGMLSFLPFVNWLALAVIALVTMRRGMNRGLKLLVPSLLASLAAVGFSAGPMPDAFAWVVFGHLSLFVLALSHRRYANWCRTATTAVRIGFLSVVLINLICPAYMAEQLGYLIVSLRQMSNTESIVSVLQQAGANGDNHFANYLLGIKIVAEYLPVFSALMLARSIQSHLFYPEGFHRELLSFRASRWIVLLMLWCVASVYFGINLGGNSEGIALGCLPIAAIYLMLAGVCVGFNVLAKPRSLKKAFLLLLPLVVLPYVMLPTYVIFGCLDSFFNFRLRFARTPSVN